VVSRLGAGVGAVLASPDDDEGCGVVAAGADGAMLVVAPLHAVTTSATIAIQIGIRRAGARVMVSSSMTCCGSVAQLMAASRGRSERTTLRSMA
jgi:hypothetical protein